MEARVSVTRFGTHVDIDPTLAVANGPRAADRDQFLFAPDGRVLAPEKDGHLYIFDPVSGGLDSLFLGGDLSGADFTPDGTVLYVGQRQIQFDCSTQVITQTLHRIDWPSRTVSDLQIIDTDFEDGILDVAVLASGEAFVTTKYPGSGQTPFRFLDIGADTLQVIPYNPLGLKNSVYNEIDDAVLTASEDNRFLLVAEVGGDTSIYDATLSDFIAVMDGSGGGAVDISAAAGLVALGSAGLVLDFNLDVAANLIGERFLDVAFTNNGKLLFALQDTAPALGSPILPASGFAPDSGAIVVFETDGMTEVGRLDLNVLLPPIIDGSSGPDVIGVSSETRDGLLILDTKQGFATLDLEAMATALDLNGTETRDVLIGTSALEVIDGGAGPDKLTGGHGRDIFVASTGARDKIVDFEIGVDRIDLEAWSIGDVDQLGITARSTSSVFFSFGDESLVVEARDRGALIPDDFGTHNLVVGSPVDLESFFLGTNGDDHLVGNVADNQLIGCFGADVFTGGGGRDEFLIVGDGTRNKVLDYTSDDLLVLANWGNALPSDLNVKQRTENSLLLYANGNSVVLQSVDPIAADDFDETRFAFADVEADLFLQIC